MPDGEVIASGFTALFAAAFGIYNWHRARQTDKQADLDREDTAKRNDLTDLRGIVRDQDYQIRLLKEDSLASQARLTACETARAELKDENYRLMQRVMRMEDQLRTLEFEGSK